MRDYKGKILDALDKKRKNEKPDDNGTDNSVKALESQNQIETLDLTDQKGRETSPHRGFSLQIYIILF